MKKIHLTIAIILVMVALSLYGCSSRTTVYQPIPTYVYTPPINTPAVTQPPSTVYVQPVTTTTTPSGTTYTGQKNRIFNSASTETLLGSYLQPGQTITVSWSADGSLTGYIFDSNEYNNWQQPYGHISVSYWLSESGSQYTYSFTVQNADNYYVVLYDGFPAGSNSIEDYSFTVTVH